MRAKHKCNKVVFIGDIVDHHAISFHVKNPNCPSAVDEAEQAQLGIDKWKRVYPTAEVMIGNHDERVIRVAEYNGIPARYLRNFAEVWHTPNWQWKPDTIIDGVFYFHGTGCGGLYPAFNRAKKLCMSCVMGHVHSASSINWLCSPTARIFGMDTGCGIDHDAWQFAYGRHLPAKPILSCGVILDGTPYLEIMPLGPGEKYHKSKWTSEQVDK
jgi:hypothetical protein